MTNLSAPTNPLYEPLTPDNSAMLLIDHQTGTMLAVQDIQLVQFRMNALALAKTARLHKLPAILSTSNEAGPNGPLMPELIEILPEAKVIARPGPIDAFEDPMFEQAVAALGRKKLIMAGVTTDICLMYPALSARARGYEVYAVYDASGCWDAMSEMVSVLRLIQAGCVPLNWAAVCAQLQGDWRRPSASGTMDIFREHLPFYGMLANNLASAPKTGKHG